MAGGRGRLRPPARSPAAARPGHAATGLRAQPDPPRDRPRARHPPRCSVGFRSCQSVGRSYDGIPRDHRVVKGEDAAYDAGARPASDRAHHGDVRRRADGRAGARAARGPGAARACAPGNARSRSSSRGSLALAGECSTIRFPATAPDADVLRFDLAPDAYLRLLDSSMPASSWSRPGSSRRPRSPTFATPSPGVEAGAGRSGWAGPTRSPLATRSVRPSATSSLARCGSSVPEELATRHGTTSPSISASGDIPSRNRGSTCCRNSFGTGKRARCSLEAKPAVRRATHRTLSARGMVGV